MPSNVEIKARVSDQVQFAEKAAQLSQSEGTIIRQRDTFFNCSQGRLKLRDFMNDSGQLIFYERPDTDGPKLSRYSISPTSDPSGLRVRNHLCTSAEICSCSSRLMTVYARAHVHALRPSCLMLLELKVR
ncbi:hypothetical protein fugu_019875 [Takifugu bimaculatus]|uniref:CYTH domain-containing protein n=1 Tax=Takifugu bimaculatus TaxID=433685 RepID=A0A4Z2BGW5_9TELE|nr:hypothetical protein fugu_019875 [Takifugu bimaculatus]